MAAANRTTGRPVPQPDDVIRITERLPAPKTEPVDIEVSVGITRWRGRTVIITVSPDDAAGGE